MKLWVKVLLFCAVGFAGGFFVIRFALPTQDPALAVAATSGKVTEIEWSTLRDLDVSSGKVGEKLKPLEGQRVRIPGFMIPLEDSQKDVSEFLLVPSPMACVHVPPPPPNQIVHVRMLGGQRAKIVFTPIWLQGRLRVAESSGPYGKAGFEIAGEATERYE